MHWAVKFIGALIVISMLMFFTEEITFLGEKVLF